ncbi:MAG: MFS transporter [Nitrososphaera sp.]|jgi:MFS family permease
MTVVDKLDSGRAAWLTLAILSGLGLIVMFDETMILPAIPDFIREFNISYSTSAWLLSAYIIAAAVMTPIGGKLSDIYGKKKILLIIMGVYAAGLLAGRLATNIDLMLAARAAQGVGMAMFPITFGIIRDVMPPKRMAIGQTIFGATFPSGAIIGLAGGAAIIQAYGWPFTFVAILPPTIALWFLILKLVRVPAVPQMPGNPAGPQGFDKSIDFKGILALASAIISFLAGITFVQSGQSVPGYLVAGLFAMSAASVAALLVAERKARSPLLDFKLIKSRNFLAPTIILLLTFLSIFTVYLTVPVMVRSPQPLGFGGDALAVATVQLPFMIVFLVGTVASGFVLKRISNSRLTLAGTVISAVGFLILLGSHSTEYAVQTGLTILAAGLSLSITGAFNVIITSVPMQMTGIALGMTLLLNLVGMSLGPTVSGALQQTNQSSVPGVQGTFPTGTAYNLIFITAAVISFAAVALSLVVAMSRRNSQAIVVESHNPHDDKQAGRGDFGH